MRARLPKGPSDAKFGDRSEPNHVRWARLFNELTDRDCAGISRSSGGAVSEKMLQNYGRPQGGYPTPMERTVALLTVLRNAGVVGWERLLGAVCEEMGGRFELDAAEAPAGSPEVRDMGRLAREFAELLDSYGQCADDDGTTEEDLVRFERELHEFETVLTLARRKVQAAAGRRMAGPRAVSK